MPIIFVNFKTTMSRKEYLTCPSTLNVSVASFVALGQKLDRAQSCAFCSIFNNVTVRHCDCKFTNRMTLRTVSSRISFRLEFNLKRMFHSASQFNTSE